MADRDKFKVWRRDKKKWYEAPHDFFITHDGKFGDFDDCGFVPCSEGDAFELVRCTGIKDKNGTLIYEGDVLTKEDYPHMDEGKQNYISIVESDNSHFLTVLRLVNKEKSGISDGIAELLEDSEEFEILGNIYSNPEIDPTKEKV